MKIKILIICMLIPLAGGAIVGLATSGSMDIYQSLDRPALAPPGWLFPVVWTILYGLMGISSYLIITSGEKNQTIKPALVVYVIQLIINLIWPFIFFSLGNYSFAFAWIILLWLLIIVMIYLFYRVSRLGAYLMIPYLVWVTFAAYLNLAII